MPNVSREQLEEMQGVVQRAAGRVRSMREKADKLMGAVIQTGEVVGTSFAMGYVRGRYKEVKLVGVPLELVVGGAAHVTAMFAGSRYADDLQNVGDGALASYVVALGAKIGDDHRQKAGGSQTTSGYYPSLGGGNPYYPQQQAYGQQPAYYGQQAAE